jgi:hypothetical protein
MPHAPIADGSRNNSVVCSCSKNRNESDTGLTITENISVPMLTSATTIKGMVQQTALQKTILRRTGLTI